MAQDSRLVALLKTYEVAERQALQHKSEIASVVNSRRQVVLKLQKEKEALRVKLELMSGQESLTALQNRDVLGMLSIARYAERLRTEISQLDAQIAERQEELQRAVEREKLAEEDLLNARIERKKVEKLLDDRKHQQRVHGAALEEALTDEMVSFVRPVNRIKERD